MDHLLSRVMIQTFGCLERRVARVTTGYPEGLELLEALYLVVRDWEFFKSKRVKT